MTVETPCRSCRIWRDVDELNDAGRCVSCALRFAPPEPRRPAILTMRQHKRRIALQLQAERDAKRLARNARRRMEYRQRIERALIAAGLPVPAPHERRRRLCPA